MLTTKTKVNEKIGSLVRSKQHQYVVFVNILKDIYIGDFAIIIKSDSVAYHKLLFCKQGVKYWTEENFDMYFEVLD